MNASLNGRAIAASLEEHTGATCDLVVDAPRPVPLSYDYVTTSLEGTVELAMRRDRRLLALKHHLTQGVNDHLNASIGTLPHMRTGMEVVVVAGQRFQTL